MDSFFDNDDNLFALEEIMYILFIFASFISINATNEKKESLYNKNIDKKSIKEQYLLSSYLILIVFITFLIRNYKTLEKTDKNSEEYKYAQTRFIGSLLIVIGQLFVVYYSSNTTTYDN